MLNVSLILVLTFSHKKIFAKLCNCFNKIFNKMFKNTAILFTYCYIVLLFHFIENETKKKKERKLVEI